VVAIRKRAARPRPDDDVRRVARWTTPEQAVRDEMAYWLSRPVAERISAVETLRELTWGIYDEAPIRLCEEIAPGCAPNGCAS
jgi:hypothetical protein